MASQQPKTSISTLGIIIWSLAALFFLYEFFLRTFVGSVAHQVISDLSLNAETFSIIGSAYYIAYGVMQIPVGILADKFGVRLIMVFATLVCAGSTFLFAHATGFNSAFVSRLLMGFGSSFAFICLLVVVVTWFPKRYFGFLSGTSQFIGTMGPLLAGGPLVALMAATHESWQITLNKVGGFGILLAVVILLVVKNKPRDAEKQLIFLQPEEPLKTRLLRLAKNKQAWAVALYSGTIYASIALLGAIWGTAYLQARGLSQGAAANIISLIWLGYAVGCPLLGALSDIAKRRKPLLIFCALTGVIATVCIVYLPLSNLTWAYGILFFSLGIAGSGQNIGFATIAEQVDVGTRATALGLNNGAITLSAAIIPPLASYFIFLSSGENLLTAEDFMRGFSIMPILYGLSFIISWLFIKETYCKPQKEAIILKIQGA